MKKNINTILLTIIAILLATNIATNYWSGQQQLSEMNKVVWAVQTISDTTNTLLTTARSIDYRVVDAVDKSTGELGAISDKLDDVNNNLEQVERTISIVGFSP